jgi:lipid-binding SYLF domain-containing protein
LQKARWCVLVFPKVYKAGIGVGGEYGEGALADRWKNCRLLQVPPRLPSVFSWAVHRSALKKFRESEGWKVGVDGSVALVDIGIGKAVDTTNIKDPVIGFVFGQKGLMYNLTLEGSKFTRIDKK